jgi:excisionase family DNA binding protein
MSDAAPEPTAPEPAQPRTPPTLAEADLAALVPEWIDWAEAARRLGVTVGKVRTMIREHELAAAVPTPGTGPQFHPDDNTYALPGSCHPGLLTGWRDRG